jgi:hypothetical protein
MWQIESVEDWTGDRALRLISTSPRADEIAAAAGLEPDGVTATAQRVYVLQLDEATQFLQRYFQVEGNDE